MLALARKFGITKLPEQDEVIMDKDFRDAWNELFNARLTWPSLYFRQTMDPGDTLIFHAFYRSSSF